ncbi:hypothetical protein J7W19_16720 [Streptomyces mobaraensis NBRC 13819 = DSM 40847]|uniref:Putative integral membrane protein n=1 Tax=Streptomyces mobaraensis (strain ATCC 29032 / DSM 40847 / JCM 4168 / NBRC 13819 / NCIMB 11159 / IPCR 16-22) TaxID=1223523 RepID=M2ZVZ1_STRM1|nr:hypothetical protein [Streptomyces mobaraensis]EME96873.1 putative integral membrane protein [Streptomyces mobaraensis NBRC 13819 = DSM 40847]QTT74812.1 hypothetical protein J7W19_16720 [Streptomyces mobaraensis NBRC 13819 = DSM 40847]
MPHPVARAGADLRLLRAAVFTAVCVLLSAAGHALASCAPVPVWTLAAGFAVVFGLVAPLAGRERSLPGIAACLAVGQVALHALFAVGQRGPEASPRTGHDGPLVSFAGRLLCNQRPPASPAEARRILTDAGLGAPAPATETAHGGDGPWDAVAHVLMPSPAMLLGHLLAALAVGWLLWRGEAALWRLVRLSERPARAVVEATLVRALRAAAGLVRAFLAGAPRQPVVRTRRTGADDERPAREPECRHVLIRRGPPRFTLAA